MELSRRSNNSPERREYRTKSRYNNSRRSRSRSRSRSRDRYSSRRSRSPRRDNRSRSRSRDRYSSRRSRSPVVNKKNTYNESRNRSRSKSKSLSPFSKRRQMSDGDINVRDRYQQNNYNQDRNSNNRRFNNQTEEKLPELLTVIKGTVKSIQSYGAFIELEGFPRTQGMVHISQISQNRLETVEDVLDVNDTVYVKVFKIEDTDNGRKKIALTMKGISQTDGRDNDPNNVEVMLDEKKRKQPKNQELVKIELDAILDTVCPRCGGKGHLQSECYSSQENQKYALIPEPDEPDDYETNWKQKTKRDSHSTKEVSDLKQALKILQQKEDKKKHRKKDKKHKKHKKSHKKDKRHKK